MSSWFENLWQIVFSKDVHSTIFSPLCSSKIDHQEAESIFPPPLTWVSSWLGYVIQSAQLPPDFPDMLTFEAQPLCCEQVHGSPRSACGWDPAQVSDNSQHHHPLCVWGCRRGLQTIAAPTFRSSSRGPDSLWSRTSHPHLTVPCVNY